MVYDDLQDKAKAAWTMIRENVPASEPYRAAEEFLIDTGLAYPCDCCERRLVVEKLKGIGYYCDDCLPFWIGDEYFEPELVSHLPVCPLSAQALSRAMQNSGVGPERTEQ